MSFSSMTDAVLLLNRKVLCEDSSSFPKKQKTKTGWRVCKWWQNPGFWPFKCMHEIPGYPISFQEKEIPGYGFWDYSQDEFQICHPQDRRALAKLVLSVERRLKREESSGPDVCCESDKETQRRAVCSAGLLLRERGRLFFGSARWQRRSASLLFVLHKRCL